jgi:hypothetical protein
MYSNLSILNIKNNFRMCESKLNRHLINRMLEYHVNIFPLASVFHLLTLGGCGDFTVRFNTSHPQRSGKAA